MRTRHREAAMMAHQTLAKAVVDQPGIADRAGKAMSACPAQCQRRITAPIEKQQSLLAPLDRNLYLFGESWGDETTSRRTLAAQIDRFDIRHVLAAEARWQHDALVAT